MRLILDERERELYDVCVEMVGAAPALELSKEVMHIGDAVIAGSAGADANADAPDTPTQHLLIERKTIADLLASIRDGRYDEQSLRLAATWPTADAAAPSESLATGVARASTREDRPLHNILYIIEGPLPRDPATRKQVLSAMTSLQFFKGFSVTRTTNLRETAELLIAMALKIEKSFADHRVPWFGGRRGDTGTNASDCPNVAPPAPSYASVVHKVKKLNLTPSNIGEIMLAQLPGFGSESAAAVMNKYGTLEALIAALRAEGTAAVSEVKMVAAATGKSRKLGSGCCQTLVAFLAPGWAGTVAENVEETPPKHEKKRRAPARKKAAVAPVSPIFVEE